MYLVVGTRPHIAFAVATLSKYNARPTVEHLAAAKRLLRYVKRTSSLALFFTRSDSESGGSLTEFTDSDYAGDADDRKSTSGYAFLLAGAAISWRSQKQKVVALSSTEAEYVGYAEATKEAIWIRQLHDELLGKTANSPQLLFCDNMSSLALVKNAKFKDTSKHIDVKHHSCAMPTNRDKSIYDIDQLLKCWRISSPRLWREMCIRSTLLRLGLKIWRIHYL
jgi:hypothetical protein